MLSTEVKRWKNTKAKHETFYPHTVHCPVPWLSVGDVWHKVAIVDQWLLPAPARSPCLCLTSQLETWRCHESRVTCSSHVTGRTGQLPHTRLQTWNMFTWRSLQTTFYAPTMDPSLPLSCLYKCAILHFVINWLSLREWKLHVQYSACRWQQ